jgi:3-hydroxyisobutyrate dehydrogenase-like beta-hydroxyacid dehydrogenase
MRTAVLGLGAQGLADGQPAHRLATGEHYVAVWNRTGEAARPVVEAGTRLSRQTESPRICPDFRRQMSNPLTS